MNQKVPKFHKRLCQWGHAQKGRWKKKSHPRWFSPDMTVLYHPSRHNINKYIQCFFLLYIEVMLNPKIVTKYRYSLAKNEKEENLHYFVRGFTYYMCVWNKHISPNGNSQHTLLFHITKPPSVVHNQLISLNYQWNGFQLLCKHWCWWLNNICRLVRHRCETAGKRHSDSSPSSQDYT